MYAFANGSGMQSLATEERMNEPETREKPCLLGCMLLFLGGGVRGPGEGWGRVTK